MKDYYYKDDYVTIFNGDCLEIMPQLDMKFDLVLTDPPYGMGWNGKISCGKGGHGKKGDVGSRYGMTITGDDKPFQPNHLLNFNQVIIFGYNHFAEKLPKGSVLVWIKRLDNAFGSFLSDAELAWMKSGHGVYCKRDLSMRAESSLGTTCHPTQKPILLMKWCIEKSKTNGTILDPYLGSGTTCVATKQLNRKCIGIEIEKKYCEIAAQRARQEVLELI